ncbi:GyrI-like domain-containing protein [Streptomyces polyrhachis]|uniref:GyrI-like domain-containing protein n=1 Tax=Streptomyces polyrhachis TaxID=1282885 RepID=A0ABW2G9R0_9ACTN
MTPQLPPPAPPAVVHLPERPYAALRRTVTPRSLGELADRIPEVLAWLAERGLEPAGPPFLRYELIEAEKRLVVEAGWPLAEPVAGDAAPSGVRAGTLPAGRYVTLVHRGHPAELASVIRALLVWARERGLRWDLTRTPGGERWGCRLESYRTDPRRRPAPTGWETELLFRLAD